MESTLRGAPPAQLSCEMCKDRKVKCDKLSPCTSCRKRGLRCVPVRRPRLPRGITRKKGQANGDDSPEVQARISVLERRLQDLVDAHVTQDALPEFDISDHDDILAPQPTTEQATDLVDAGDTDGNNVDTLSQQLMQVYVERVDPLLPILPGPAIADLMSETHPYSGYPIGHPAPKALASAIRYSAVGSITDEECLRMFGVEKSTWLKECVTETVGALEEVDYINTNDLTVLQAFVLFLLALRTHDRTRRPWTMLSVAVRIAQSMSLYEAVPTFAVDPLEGEMRRRLWHAIGLLDVQAAFDRGSEPMLSANCLALQVFTAPSDITVDPVVESFHDPRFARVVAKAQSTFRSLENLENTDLASRKALAASFREDATLIVAEYEGGSPEFRWFLRKLIEIIHAFAQLLAFRPLRGTTSPFTLLPSTPQGGLLLLSLKYLQAMQQFEQDSRSTRFIWYLKLYVPWHTLSVAIDEACATKDKALLRHCRPVIEGYLDFFRDSLTDAHQASLARPIARLSAMMVEDSPPLEL